MTPHLHHRVLTTLLALVLTALVTTAHAEPALTGAVLSTIDGDTIMVWVDQEHRAERGRLIGIDSPELHHPILGEQPGGREAALVARPLLDGRRVRLELDVEQRDRYGRLLAYG